MRFLAHKVATQTAPRWLTTPLFHLQRAVPTLSLLPHRIVPRGVSIHCLVLRRVRASVSHQRVISLVSCQWLTRHAKQGQDARDGQASHRHKWCHSHALPFHVTPVLLSNVLILAQHQKQQWVGNASAHAMMGTLDQGVMSRKARHTKFCLRMAVRVMVSLTLMGHAATVKLMDAATVWVRVFQHWS